MTRMKVALEYLLVILIFGLIITVITIQLYPNQNQESSINPSPQTNSPNQSGLTPTPKAIGSSESSIEQSYSIYAEGNLYYAKSSNDSIQYSGANFASVFNKAVGNGNSIALLGGNYYLTHTLLPESNMFIEGLGATITVAPNSNQSIAISVNNKANVTIQGLHLEGQENKETVVGIYLNATTNCSVQDCNVNNFYNRGIIASAEDGLGQWGYQNNIINNNVTKTSATVNAETIVLGYQFDAVVAGNIARLSQHGGITLSICYNCTVSNNTVMDADGQGVGYGGIDLERSNYNTVTGNVIGGRSRGIRVSYNSSNNIISDNIISGVAKDGIVFQGALGGCLENCVSGNTITGCGLCGVIIDANCTGTSLIGNEISRCSTLGVESYANFTTISGGSIHEVNLIGGGTEWPSVYFVRNFYSSVNSTSFYGSPSPSIPILLSSTSNCTISGVVAQGGYCGLEEEGSSDYNIISGCSFQGMDTLLLIGGVHTKVTATYSNNTWYP